MPTAAQLESLYRVGYQLTYTMLQPIHLICVDNRIRNLYILAGYERIQTAMSMPGLFEVSRRVSL